MVSIPNNQFPDLENHVDEILVKATGLEAGKKITAEVRKNLHKLLHGKEEQLLPKAGLLRREVDATPEVQERVFAEIVKTHAKIFAILKDKDGKPRKQKLSTAVRGHKEIEKLVRDPESKDSQALVWFFNNVIASSGMPATDIEQIFGVVDHATQEKVAKAEKAREIYQRIEQDSDNFSIGDAKTPGTRIAVLSRQIRGLDKTLKANIGTKGFDSRSLFEEQRAARADILKFEMKKKTLRKQLGSLHAELKGFTGLVGALPPGIEDNLQPNFIDDLFPAGPHSYAIGSATKDSTEWVTSDSAGETLKKLKTKGQTQGTGLPSAKVILENLVKKNAAGSLHFASDEQKAAYVSYMMTMMTQGGSAPEAHGADADAGEGGGGGGGGHGGGGHGGGHSAPGKAGHGHAEPKRGWLGSFHQWMLKKNANPLKDKKGSSSGGGHGH